MLGTEVIYMYTKLFTEAPGYLTIIKIQSRLINFPFKLSAFLLFHREGEDISPVDCQPPRGPSSYLHEMPDCNLLPNLFLSPPSKAMLESSLLHSLSIFRTSVFIS